MEKPSFEDLMKLIGELGQRSSGGNISLGYMPARMYNGFGESEGLNYNDWGYVVGAKVSGTDREITAQDKELIPAMEKLVVEILKHYSEALERRREEETKALEVMKKFNDKFKVKELPSGSPYR